MSGLRAQIQEQLVGDGLVILATDWRVLGSGTYIEIKNEIKVEGLDPHEFKGATYISNRHVRKIRLQVPGCEACVSVLISCPENDPKLLDDVIQKSYAEAVDFAFSKLRPGITTMNRRSKMCHTMTEKLEQKTGPAGKCRCTLVQYLKVEFEDVAEFGKHLQEHMMLKMGEKGQQYDCCLLIHRFGQSLNWTDFCKLYHLEPRFATQMIVHVARDYFIPGKCLLWNREKLQGFACGNLTGEEEVFHPLMTVGHANVEYDRTKSKFKTKYVAAAASGMTYAHVKFYTDTYKEVHRIDETKQSISWKKAVVMKSLTGLQQSYGFELGRHPDKALTEPKDVQEAIRRLQTMTEGIQDKDHNKARLEAIIVAPGSILAGRRKRDVWNEYLTYFERKLLTKSQTQPVRSLLGIFEYNDLLVQINETIVKAYKTLNPIIEETIQRRNQNEYLTSIPRYECVQLAVVCESLIAFSIYGQMNFFRNKSPEEDEKRKKANHNRRLIKKLKLDPCHYKEMLDENPFHGLEYCGHDLKTHGRLLSWEGDCELEKTMWYNLVDDLTDVKYLRDQQANARPAPAANSEDQTPGQANRKPKPVADPGAKADADALHDILQQLNSLQRRNFPDEYDGPFTVLCEIIWKTLIKHCSRVTKAAKETILLPERGLVARIDTFGDRNLTFSSPKTFVEDLFRQTQYLQYIGFAHYLRDMYHQLNPPKQLALRKKLVLFIEDKLLTLESPGLLYPFSARHDGHEEKLYAILPFCGGTQMSYARAGVDVKRRIKILYSYAFERKYGEKCNDELLHDALSAASTFEERRTFDAYISQLESNRLDDLLSKLYCFHLRFELI